MTEFFSQHGGTLFVGAILVIMVAIVVRSLLKGQQSDCSSHCSGCAKTCAVPEIKKGLAEYTADQSKEI